MKVFSYTPGDSDIAILSALRNQAIALQTDQYTEMIPTRNRDLCSLMVSGAGTLCHLKLHIEASDGLYLQETTEVVMAGGLSQVTLPDKYKRMVSSITSVKVSGDATDYYTGGSVDIETGIITLGTPLSYVSQVIVVFETWVLAASAQELQTALDNSDATIFGNDSGMVWEINETTSFNKYMDFNPPAQPFIRIKVEGQSDNGADSVISINVVGVIKTKTS